MQPPRPSGDRRTLWILLGTAGVLVVILLIAGGGLVAYRLLSAGGDAAGPLRIVPVASTAPGPCPSGGPGVGSVDGRTCYRLGQGGMTVRRLESAEAERDPYGWHVNIRLDSDDARRFTSLTGRYVKHQLALVSNGKVLTAPMLREPIAGGEVQITGNFTEEQAKKIAAELPD